LPFDDFFKICFIPRAFEISQHREGLIFLKSFLSDAYTKLQQFLVLDDPKSGRRSADHLQQQPPEKGSFRNRRTRSASRERNLAKIRFCWRCHQTGHESFDCTAELQPANWCPRCLETSHWEDNCWVNEQEVFCNICTLPGHLPCVHQTNDFRQRKLVIETFGWLAFKDWFREPEFWSWWNCSGFTNVPLYKLMQHRPHVASPTDLQEITE